MTSSGTLRKVGIDELLSLVKRRSKQVRAFLEFARENEESGWSLRLAARPDIRDAEEAARAFPQAWWGHVVFSCFGSVVGARVAAEVLVEPLAPEHASEALATLTFPRRSVGHHRIQPGVTGAKKALVGACGDAEMFEEVLHSDLGFDERYAMLYARRPAFWGRTTIFDLLMRAGVLGVGGRVVTPDRAYLLGSTGPAKGFQKIFGTAVSEENGEWAESVLRAWTEHWADVANLVGAVWSGEPYQPGDFENSLCIWQEPRFG